MARKVKFAGVGTSRQYLIVYADVEVNGVNHPETVRVPWSALTRDEVQYDLNLAVAARLRAMWEADTPFDMVSDDLPGIG